MDREPKIEIYKGNALDVLRGDIGMFDAVITDPPYASGSTLAAARAEGYDAVGIEVHGEIVEAAAERLGVEAIAA